MAAPRLIYWLGRALQVLALAVMPFSLWAGFLGHNESASIGIFLGSIVCFYAGYLLTQLGIKI